MKMGRVLLAGLAGGVAMYAWSSIAHIALPLGEVGVSQITENEAAVLGQMRSALGERSGLYIFPSLGPGDRSQTMKTYDAKLLSNPSGLLIYHPPGAKSLEVSQLLTEFFVELLAAVLAIWLLAQTRISNFAGRVGFVAAMGLLASLPTNLAYWNWYRFPGSYTAAYMFTQIVGFLVAGFTAAWLLRKQPAVIDRPL